MKFTKFRCEKCGREIEVVVPYCGNSTHRGKAVAMRPIEIISKRGVIMDRKPREPNLKQIPELLKQELKIALRISKSFDRRLNGKEKNFENLKRN